MQSFTGSDTDSVCMEWDEASGATVAWSCTETAADGLAVIIAA